MNVLKKLQRETQRVYREALRRFYNALLQGDLSAQPLWNSVKVLEKVTHIGIEELEF